MLLLTAAKIAGLLPAPDNTRVNVRTIWNRKGIFRKVGGEPWEQIGWPPVLMPYLIPDIQSKPRDLEPSCTGSVPMRGEFE